jgi:hypothetical protein
METYVVYHKIMQRQGLPLSRKTQNIFSQRLKPTMAPSRKDKTKAKHLASEEKSMRTPSSKKSTWEKRKKSSSSSAQKIRKHLSTLNPLRDILDSNLRGTFEPKSGLSVPEKLNKRLYDSNPLRSATKIGGP